MERDNFIANGEAINSLRNDINRINAHDYDKPSSDVKPTTSYHRERIREDAIDTDRQARINLSMRQERREREKMGRDSARTTRNVNERMGNTISINDLKEKFDNSEGYPSLEDKFDNFEERVAAFKERLANNPITSNIYRINILKYPPSIKVSVALMLALAGGAIVYDHVFNTRPELSENAPIERVYEEDVDAIDGVSVTLEGMQNVSDTGHYPYGKVSIDPNNTWGNTR